jgi:hypothetical protein
MKEFDIEFDDKAHAFVVSHNNILKDLAKEFEESLIIKPFQVSVQVAFDKEVKVSDPKVVEKELLKVVSELALKVREEIYTLQEKVEKLKKDEDAGSKTAAQDADKEAKATKKKLEKLAGEFGMRIRTAVEKELAKQHDGKVKGRSASRTVVRDIDIDEDYFDEASKSEQSEPYFGKLAQTLATSGKEIAKLTIEEKNLRKDLGDEIMRIYKLVETARGNKATFDIKAFAKSNATDARKLEGLASKYMEFVKGMDDKLDALHKSFMNFYKLVKGAESLDDEKQIEKHVDEYESALSTVKGTIDDKIEAARCAQFLLKDEYKKGDHWPDLAAFLDGLKAAANSGTRLQDHGAALVKLAKK